MTRNAKTKDRSNQIENRRTKLNINALIHNRGHEEIWTNTREMANVWENSRPQEEKKAIRTNWKTRCEDDTKLIGCRKNYQGSKWRTNALGRRRNTSNVHWKLCEMVKITDKYNSWNQRWQG